MRWVSGPESVLPVEDLVQVVILYQEGDIVRWQRLSPEEFWEAVLFGPKSRPEVKVSFILEDGFPQLGYVICRQLQAIKRIDDIEQSLERIGLVHDSKGNK